MPSAVRFLIRYIAIALAGTVIILALVPWVRALWTERQLDQVDAALAAGHPDKAAQLLDRVAPWAAIHPSFLNHWATAQVRCLAQLGDLATAEATARAMFEGQPAPPSAPCSTFERLLHFQKPIVDHLLRAKGMVEEYERTAGYRALAEELARMGRNAELADLARRIAANHPNESTALRIRAEIAALDATTNNPRTTDFGRHQRTPSAPPARPPPSLPPSTARQQDISSEPKDDTPPAISASPADTAAAAQSDTVPAPQAAPKKLAVVRGTNTRAYDLSGRFLRVIPAGTVVEIETFRNSNVGAMAVCRSTAADSSSQQFLILTGNLDLVTAQNGGAAEREKELRVLRACLEAELAALKDINSANPHAGEYAAAKKAYDDFWNAVRELQAKRDAAVGEKRMRYSDELYKLKGRSVEVGQRYEAARKKYEEWQRTTAGDKADDPRVVHLRARLAEVESELSALVSGNR